MALDSGFFDNFCQVTFPKCELALTEPCLHGIAPDVADHIPQVIFIPDQAIKTIVLPKLATFSEGLIDLPRRVELPAVQHVLQFSIGT